MGTEEALVQTARATWGMRYADDTGNVPRSPSGLTGMLVMIVEMPTAFSLMVSDIHKETVHTTEAHTAAQKFRITAAGQNCAQANDLSTFGVLLPSILSLLSTPSPVFGSPGITENTYSYR